MSLLLTRLKLAQAAPEHWEMMVGLSAQAESSAEVAELVWVVAGDWRGAREVGRLEAVTVDFWEGSRSYCRFTIWLEAIYCL